MERLAQSETYYPTYQEPDSGVTAVAFGIRRFSDGYWYDFNDTTFKASGWTTKHQALAEDDDGLWTYDTGLAMPDSDEVYTVQFRVTDASGTFYTYGPKIIVNSNLLDILSNLQLEASTNYIKSVPQDFEDVSIADADTLGSDAAGEVLRWLRWFIKNTWDVDTTPDPDEMNIYQNNGTTKGYCFQVYTSSNHNYRQVAVCS